MTDFLEKWDAMNAHAKATGKPAILWHDDGTTLRMVARTMHPAFMASHTPKYDPTRDNKD